MDGVATEQITETGRTGRGPPLQTWPGKRNERDQCRANGTDGPARKSESPGRYEQQGAPPKSLIWIYYLVKKHNKSMERCEPAGASVCACVDFVYVFMLKTGHVY